MDVEYAGVVTRFLSPDEQLIATKEKEMPLVIEAHTSTDLPFLHQFLASNSTKIKEDIAKYGAVLLRGFDVVTDSDFENTVLSIQGFKGISDAFMSEEGRTHAGDLKYVLYTNAIYKTGGTLYLGGFHSENYYSADVPSFICFCCIKPSTHGGETGLINMEKIYEHLNEELKKKLEKNTFFASRWLLGDVEKRYQISREALVDLCNRYDLPIVGQGDNQFILMYKPNIFIHPLTGKKALQINLFEITNLNEELRLCFMNDYQGKTWYWHRIVWKLPKRVIKTFEYGYMTFANLFYSPKEAFHLVYSKLKSFKASIQQNKVQPFNDTRVGSCFTEEDVKELAQLIRDNYSSCLWKKGDIMLIDNKKIMHAGMPGAGPRLVRAMICNPLEMTYSLREPGIIDCVERGSETIGYLANTCHHNQSQSSPLES